MHLLSVSGGIPLVDAHAPVVLELANHCRQAKIYGMFKLWEKTNQMNKISILKLIDLNSLI